MSAHTDSMSNSSIRYGLVVRIPGSHPGGPGSIPGNGNFFSKISTRMGFEPTRAEPIGLAVQRLNHSATSSLLAIVQKNGNVFPRQELRYPCRYRSAKNASAGNRTRINCLEGSYADHYTTDAFPPPSDKRWDGILKLGKTATRGP